MAKNIRKKQRSKPKETGKPMKQLQAGAEDSTEEAPFDFGGLPARDLKKNLGCG